MQAGDYVRTIEVEAYVCAIGELAMKERMAIARLLWDNDIKVRAVDVQARSAACSRTGTPPLCESRSAQAEFSYKRNPKVLDQLNYCEKNGIPLALLVGNDEVQAGVVKVKTVNNRDDKGTPVPLGELVAEIKRRLADPAVLKLTAAADLTAL